MTAQVQANVTSFSLAATILIIACLICGYHLYIPGK